MSCSNTHNLIEYVKFLLSTSQQAEPRVRQYTMDSMHSSLPLLRYRFSEREEVIHPHRSSIVVFHSI